MVTKAGVHGHGADLSAAAYVLAAAADAQKSSLVANAGSRIVAPVGVVGAAAIDLVAHAVMLVAKTVALTFNAVAWVMPWSTVKIHDAVKPEQIFNHAWRVAGSVALVIPAALISIFSADAALRLAKSLGLSKKDPAKWEIQQFMDDFKAGWKEAHGAVAKAKFAATRTLEGAYNGVKSNAIWAKDELKYYGWNKWNDHPHARLAAYGAVAAAAYGYAVYKQEDGVFGPVKAGYAATSNGVGSVYNSAYNLFFGAADPVADATAKAKIAKDAADAAEAAAKANPANATLTQAAVDARKTSDAAQQAVVDATAAKAAKEAAEKAAAEKAKADAPTPVPTSDKKDQLQADTQKLAQDKQELVKELTAEETAAKQKNNDIADVLNLGNLINRTNKTTAEQQAAGE